MKITRREFLESLPKTALKLSLAYQALSGLTNLVFAEEDYLSKLPDLNGRKVTEELIQEMLNVGSVKGILEQYGNKENIFYVKFERNGRNNLDDLVRKDPDRWDGSYVQVGGNKNRVKPEVDFRHSILLSLLAEKKRKIKFIFYDLDLDQTLKFKTHEEYIIPEDHFLFRVFDVNKKNPIIYPARLIYSNKGRLLDGGYGGTKTNNGICAIFNNESIWLDYWFYNKNKVNERGEEIIIRYKFTSKIKEEKR